MATRALIVLAAAALLWVCPHPASALDCILIEDFAKGQLGEFPPEWKLRKDAGRGVYSVREEGGRRFLHAASASLGIQAAKQFAWDLSRYPVLAWDWRPIEFPKGADERKSSTNDSALAVYAVFPHTVTSLKSVKYVWSAVVPAGTRLASNGGLTQALVVKSGTGGRSQWAAQGANVLDDYRKFFEASDVPRPEGIAVLTDFDDTKSSAQGDYANFRACTP